MSLNTMSGAGNNVCLVGHPYAPIGMGEHVRNTYRALRSVNVQPALTDIYQMPAPNGDGLAEFAPVITDRQADINIFHINGNEVEQGLTHLAPRRPWHGYNVIYPLWELPKYPAEWARELDRFDEIWAPSRFIYDSLKAACTKPVFHMPLACDIALDSFLGRRYFGIPESDYTFLFFYDLRSYTTRKNPQAVVKAFRKLQAERPYSRVHLVIKVNGIETNRQEFERLTQELADLRGNVTLIQHTMTGNEVKNLVRCCDCFVSLHRSEGYGFGIAEAMVLGKPVIATAFSGNMDFMSPEVSYGVGYELVEVKAGEYPHYHGQVWADAKWEEAAARMIALVDSPETGYALGKRASQHMRAKFGYQPIGLNYLDRLEVLKWNCLRRANLEQTEVIA